MKAFEVLALVARSEFRPMDSYDREAFAGTNSPNPLIHYADEAGEKYTIILDGDKICLINQDGEEFQFLLGEEVFA